MMKVMKVRALALTMRDKPISSFHHPYPIHHRHHLTTMPRTIISTPQAPAAVGTYSQAVKVGSTVYVSGQIPLDPATGQIVDGAFEVHVRRVFDNLLAIVTASGGNFSHVTKLNVFLTDLANFAVLNKVMAEYFKEPYPARAAIQVAALPKGAIVEMDCIVELD
jgi:reactive intermediate/imine deaminase